MELHLFDAWNEKKKKVHASGKSPHFRKGEIWWAQLGQNIATEVVGKGDDFLRPVLVLQVVYGNACLAIPLTSKKREGDYYFSFQDSNGTYQCALLVQIKYLDGKRLKYKQSFAQNSDLEKIQTSIWRIIKK